MNAVQEFQVVLGTKLSHSLSVIDAKYVGMSETRRERTRVENLRIYQFLGKTARIRRQLNTDCIFNVRLCTNSQRRQF